MTILYLRSLAKRAAKGSPAVAALLVLLLLGCNSKLKEEYDFRPYFAAWAGRNCGQAKKYHCLLQDGFADEGFDGDDYVYGIYYLDANSKKRIVYVKVSAKKPHEATVVDDRPTEES